MMTRRLRLVCALVLALQVLATSGEAGAWNQITHQYINDRVLKVTPLPDAAVCSLHPEISARLVDLAPSP